MWADRVHRVEPAGRLFLALPTRQEDDAGHRSRHVATEAANGLVRDLLVRDLVRRVVARKDHVRLEQDAFGLHTLIA
jgi:hypothetical protein